MRRQNKAVLQVRCYGSRGVELLCPARELGHDSRVYENGMLAKQPVYSDICTGTQAQKALENRGSSKRQMLTLLFASGSITQLHGLAIVPE